MVNVSSSNGLEKCPKLRFPGFDEPWKAIKFGNIVHEFSDRTKVEDEDILLSAAIEGMFLNTELFGHQRGASNKGYKKIKYGTMVLSTQNLHLGNANVNQRFEHGMVSPAYKTYDISGCSVDLIAQWIKSDAAKHFFYNATTVGASVCRRNVEWDTLYGQSLYLPSLPEQEKIAQLLTLLSKRIEKQQQLVNALKKYKRGLLQVIFDDNTVDLFGEVKQSNFVKLSDILIFQNGINADSSKYGQGRKYISVSDILKNDFITYEQIVGLIDIDDITLEKYSVTYGDVLFQRSSETREDAGRSNVYLDKIHTATFGGFVIRGKKKAEYNPLYLKYALDSASVRKQIMKCAAGAQHINVSQDDLSNVIVNLPGMKVQDGISCFISHLDNRINFISQEKKHYQLLRTALLQQLFI